MRGNLFLVHGHNKDLPQITWIFHLFKYVVNESFSVSHFTSQFFLRRLLHKSYFKIVTFQPNFLCSSSFNKKALTYLLCLLSHICYSIYTWTWNVNVKREGENSNRRFSFVCIPYRRERDVNVKREFMTCDREARAWNRLLHVAIFHVHAQHSRARNKHKKTSFYARGKRETN